MMSNQAEVPIETMARSMSVSRSGFYAWQFREPSAPDLADEELADLIRHIHAVSRISYGSPRIYTELAVSGVLVGRECVETLMKAAGLASAVAQAPERQPAMTGCAPLPIWSTATSMRSGRTCSGWQTSHLCQLGGILYLAVMLDAFSRQIVGWSMGTNLETQLILEAMSTAVGQRKPSDAPRVRNTRP